MAVCKSTGPILELGCGWGSTPMLRMMGRALGREVESYDNNKEWAAIFGAGYVENWAKWEPKAKSFGAAFFDCSPGEERKSLLLKMQGRAKFLVAHDHEAGSAAAYYYEHITHLWKYAEVFRALRPHTLILSDIEPLGLTEWDMGEIHA